MEENSRKDQEIKQIPVNSIVPNPNQPRKAFSEEGILKLADSIRQFGIIQPLVVRKTFDGYELISGERRLRASRELGLKEVPCILSNVSESTSAEMSIIENLIREDLNIFEQASAIQALIDTYSLTQEQIAQRLSNSQSFVANKLRLLRLAKEEKDTILKHNLSERHARALLRIQDPSLRQRILEKIINEGLNVSKTDEIIDKLTEKEKGTQKSNGYKDLNAFCQAIDRVISQASTCGVNIKSRKIESDNYTELTILIPKNTDAKCETEATKDTQELVKI